MSKGTLTSSLIIAQQPSFTKWTSSNITYGFYNNFDSLSAFYKTTPVLQVPFAPYSGPTPRYDEPNLVASLNTDEIDWAKSYFESLLGGEKFIGNFIDVNFSMATAGSADISIGALQGFTTPSADAWSTYGSTGATGTDPGDIWLTDNARIGATGRPVDWFHHGILHEIGHALGLSHTFQGGDSNSPLPGLNTSENTQKFSVMAYKNHSREIRDVFELQLYDIAALQFLYGKNSEYYSQDTGYINFAIQRPGSGVLVDRIFTIWDGGGIDTIDASLYSESAYVDLRPGYFSSIGPDAFSPNGFGSVGSIGSDFTVSYAQGGLGRENVSIAFGAYIENAVGGSENDVIIGNMLSNQVYGGGGNDLLFADGFGVGLADKVLAKLGRAITGLNANLNSSSDDADYRQIDTGGIVSVGSDAAPFVNDRTKQEDQLVGGFGDDLLVGSDGRDLLYGDSGNDLLIGSAGNDVLKGAEGNDVLLGGVGNDWLEGGEDADLIEGDSGDDRIIGGKGDDKDASGVNAGLYGGFGDDLFISELNDGDDYLDGGFNGFDLLIGDGTDTVVYKYAQGNSTIRITGGAWFSSQTAADFGIEITGAQDASGAIGSFGNDTLTSIEKASVESGSGTDRLVLDGKSYTGYLNYVDLGGQGSGLAAGDLLDASFLANGIDLDLRDSSNQNIDLNDGVFVDSKIRLRNVENVIGSGFGDTIYATNAASGSAIQGNSGNDIIYGGSSADDLKGGSGDDYLEGGGGADILDGGTGADILVIDDIDLIARGEVEDKLYWKSYSALAPWNNRLKGGTRTVVVNDSQTWEEQIVALLNSGLPYKGALGEMYEVTGSGATQGLKITMKSGEAIDIPRWSEGEYGISLQTSKRRTVDFNVVDIPPAGFPSQFGALGTVIGFVVNLVNFTVALAVDPAWRKFAGDTFSLAQLQLWADQPGNPPASNNITGTQDGEAINGRLTDDRILGGDGGDSIDGFAGDDFIDGGSGDDSIFGGIGADRIEGGAGNDTLEGGAGNDTIIAGPGVDLIIVRAGGGTDVISADTQDTIRFEADIDPASIVVSAGASGGGAAYYGEVTTGNLSFSFGADKVTIQGAAFGAVEFADGTVKTAATLARASIASATTDGNDTIVGFGTADGIRGGAGNDYINGLGGNDRYYFGRGDGQDRIEDSAGIADKIIFGANIAPTDIVASISYIATGPRQGQELVRLAIAGTSDWVEFVGRDIERVQFQDGTIWFRGEFAKRALTAAGTSGDDWISVSPYLDGIFNLGAGNDVIIPQDNAFVQYEFGLGSGQDRIELYNYGQTVGGFARINLASGIGIGDLNIQRLGDGMSFAIEGTGDRLDVVRRYEGRTQSNIRDIDLALNIAGEILTAATIERIADVDAFITQRQMGTSAGETLNGTLGGDRIAAKDGNDQLFGYDGSDLLFAGAGDDVVSGGTGNDMLFGEAGNDALTGGDGDDALYAGAGVDNLQGGAGSDQLTGNGASTLNGGVGNDILNVRLGDNIEYNLGDGSDELFLSNGSSTADGNAAVKRSVLTLGAGIDPLATTLSLEGWAVYININGTSSDRIRLDRVFQRNTLPEIRFNDGTIWRESEIAQRLFNPDNANNTPAPITSAAPDWDGRLIAHIYGGGGNDILNEASVSASEYRFFFAPGGGTDTITSSARTGSILHLAGFDPDQLVLARSGIGLRDFTLTFSGSSDSVVIQSQEVGGANGSARISEFIFNGVTYFSSQIRELWLSQTSTAGNDTITAFDGPGGVQDTGITPGIQFSPNPGNDRIQGGLGNDTMIGGTGDDTYIVNVGDGIDTIRDLGIFSASASAGYDLLQLGALSTDARFAQSSADNKDLVITFSNSTDQITVDEFFALGAIEELEFGDGVVLSALDVQQLAIAGSETAANDVIRGTSSPDTLAGGAGNDTLDGLAGADRYVFDADDGHDVIADTGATESNILYMGVGVSIGALTFQRIGNNLKIALGTDHSVTINGHFSGAATRTVGQFLFADGTRKSAAEIDQLYLDQLATSGNDTIAGFTSNDIVSGAGGNDILNGGAGVDTLVGGIGNDTLNGQQGADVYLIALGDGQDIIASTGDTVVSDSVRFASGVGQRDLEFVRPTPISPDLLVKIRGTSQQVTISNYFGGLAVKQFEFADGTLMSSTDVALALANAAPVATSNVWRPELAEGGLSRVEVPTNLFGDGSDTASLVFNATLGDGSPLPSWLQLVDGVFAAQPNDADVGTWSIKLTAIDEYGASAERIVKFDVVNARETPIGSAIGTQDAPVGAAFNFTLPANVFSDEDSAYNVVPTVVAGTYTSAEGGSLVVDASGGFSYTPLAAYVGPDSVYVPFNVGTSRPIERPFDFASTGSNLAGNVPLSLAPARDVLTISAKLSDGTPLPAWLAFDGAQFIGTPSAADEGPLAIDIIATDGSGNRATIPFALRVGTSNVAPTASTLSGLAAAQGEAFAFSISDSLFADANSHDRIAYSVTLADDSPLPAWLTFDGLTLSGTPANGDIGSISLKITGTDIFGASASTTATLTIDDTNDAPVVGAAIADQLATQGQAFSFAIPGIAFADPDVGQTLSLSATLDTGDALPVWLSFANGVISGTPADEDTGLYRIKIAATDAAGLSTHQYFVLGVVDTNDAPTVAESLPTLLAPINQQTVFRIPASLFADNDDPGYSVSVSLADGSPLPSWIVYDAYADTIAFSPATSQLFRKTSAATEVAIRITATDTRGASTSTTVAARIVSPTLTSTLVGGGASTLTATSAYELIDPGLGSQTINGSGSGDRVIFGRGYGLDVVNLGFTDGQIGAVVEFGPDITLADLSFSRADYVFGTGTNRNDLGIKINGTSDELRIYNQFEQTLGAETVREFLFADGTSLGAAQLVSLMNVATADADILRGSHVGETLAAGAGSDVVYGLDGDDIIDGGAGDDILYGDANGFGYGGSDTFLFGRGSGNDLIFADSGTITGVITTHYQLGIDTLRFGPNVLPSDLIVTHLSGYPTEVGNDRAFSASDAGALLIQISGTNDSVKIDHQFYLRHPDQNSIHTYGIERFEFANGTIMNRAQFEALISLAPTTAGNDAIYGGAAADRLVGGLGDDLLVGEDGADTYAYSLGDGNDRIVETAQMRRVTPALNSAPGAGDIISFDTLTLGLGIAPENIIFTKADAYGEDLIVSFNNASGQIYIEGQFRNILHGEVPGFFGAVASYYGVENAAIDEIRFADGTTWSLADIYAFSVRATPGNDEIDGFFRVNETLDGGAGNDLLAGRNGNDTYVFARGYGHDVVKEVAWFYSDGSTVGQTYTAADKISFVGVASTDVTTSIGAGGSFIFRINDTGETLTIAAESEFGNFTSIQFSDTTWNAAQFQARWTVAAATAGDDIIYGFTGNDTINGGDGNDILRGGQNSGTPQTGLGFDTLSGGLGSDTLILESSDNDRANGDDGDDLFRIVMTLPYWSNQNSSGVLPDRARIDYPNFVNFGSERGIIDGGVGQDTLILAGSLADYWRGDRYFQDNGNGSYTISSGVTVRNIETVQFADGAVSFAALSTASYRYRRGVIEGTAAAETLNGTAGYDAIYGYAGNDTLNGLDGDDFLIGGAGTDTFNGGNGTDVVDYSYDTVSWNINLSTNQAVQSTTTETFVSIEGAYGSAAADTITGSANANIIAGGKGDDIVNAGGGDDFIEFEGSPSNFAGLNDGFDAIDGGLGNDIIRATYHNAVIGLSSITGVETITANGFTGVYILGSAAANTLNFSSTTLVGVERIDGGGGNDIITGTAIADTILGGAGDDNLAGGDGNDIFKMAGTTDGFDAVSGGAGFDRILADQSSTRIGLTTISGIEEISDNGQGGAYISGSSGADNLDFTNVILTRIDRIDGGSGNDIITGSSANDIIRGSGGDDILLGGLGNDLFQYTGTSNGADNVQGGAGTNSIEALANSTVIGLSAISAIQSISAGIYTGVSIAGSSNADTLNFSAVTLSGISRIDGGSGNDSITGSALADTILGSGGDDTLTGGSGDDVFQFTGSANGADVINGGLGTDSIVALAANTVIGLSAFSDVESISGAGFAGVTIAGSANADILDFTVISLTSIASVNGGAGNDVITGTAGIDVIFGGADNDILNGADGNDTLNGGAGANILDGGNGTDVAQYSGNAGTYSVSLNGDGSYNIVGVGIDDTLRNIENLNFTDGTVTVASRVGIGLTLTGTAAADTLTGGASSDTITGLGGDDTLNGGGGDDLFRVTGTGDGFDIVDGGSGNDVITATVNNATIGLTSAVGIEGITAGGFTGVSIAGSAVANTLNFSSVALTNITKIDGGAGNDIITGSVIADTILGSGGDDVINAGDGNDTIQFTGTASGFDAVDGGVGTDTISALANSTVIGLTSVTGVETISAGTFTGVTIAGSANADTLNFGGVTLTGITLIDGGAGNDVVTGNSAANTIRGSGGDDVISAGDGNDTIQFTGTASGFDAVDGGAGTDTISALANSTVIGLSSLAGVETVSAGAFTGVRIVGSCNADTLNFATVTLTAITRIEGGAGNDVITGNSAANVIWGGTQNDTLDGSAGNDTLLGDDGDDVLRGGAGNDVITGGTGNDTVDYGYATANLTVNLTLTTAQTVASGDADTITTVENVIGGSGADTLTGTTAVNTLDGGSGNDRLIGGLGNDTIIGGVGTTDTAVYAGLQASYSIQTNAGVVSVVDNQPTTDGNDGTDTISGIERLEFKGGVIANVTSPIILDLDGNGVRTVSAANSNARYDLDGDGLADDTSWIGSTEGFLFLDRNSDGKVTDAGEFSFINDVPGARSDLEGLRAFDSNGDGILSSMDARFNEFNVWQDRDGDGAADTGEILTLTAAGVRSIGLTGTAVNATTAIGEVAVLNRGTYTRTNGTTMEFLDAIITSFSAAATMPELAVQQMNYGRKASKYSISFADGALTLSPDKRKGDIDPRAGALTASTVMTFKNKTVGLLSPIILDLDGDGIELRSIKKAKAAFDMNGDGALDDTGWTGGDDGFLVIDRNNDGRITEAAELSFAAEDPEAASDLAALAMLDSNEDGLINGDDARFGELKVWRDANGNGVTDAGELSTLADLGIAEIGLRGQNREGRAKVGENILISTTTFKRANGSTGSVGNVALAYTPGTAAAAASASIGEGRFVAPTLRPEDDFFTPVEEAAGAASAASLSSSLQQAIEVLRSGASGRGGLAELFAADGFGAATDADETLSHDLASERVLASEVDPANAAIAPDNGVDRLLAMIAQDMASFGARGGDAGRAERRETVKSYEYFA